MFIRDAEPEELDYLEAVYARDAQPGKKGQMAGKVFNNIASGAKQFPLVQQHLNHNTPPSSQQ